MKMKVWRQSYNYQKYYNENESLETKLFIKILQRWTHDLGTSLGHQQTRVLCILQIFVRCTCVLRDLSGLVVSDQRLTCVVYTTSTNLINKFNGQVRFAITVWLVVPGHAIPHQYLQIQNPRSWNNHWIFTLHLFLQETVSWIYKINMN